MGTGTKYDIFISYRRDTGANAARMLQLALAARQYAARCPWETLNGWDWANLLGGRPQFADRCPWEKLDDDDWARLLESQPQFAKYRKN